MKHPTTQSDNAAPGGNGPAEGAVPPSAAPASAAPAEAQPALSPELVAQWKARAEKADEHWDRLLRARADLENYRKRAAREKEEAVRYANQHLLVRLLPVLDSFEMALSAAAPGNPEALESLQSGVAMIHQQLKTALAEAGLEEVNAAGQPFDPNFHEAVSQVETADVQAGHVARQLRKGYRLRDRLLRPASVVVAKQPAS